MTFPTRTRLENISTHKFLAQIRELEHIVEIKVMNTIPLKDITCNVDYIILALKYLISPSKSTSKSTQEHRNRIIVTFKAETVHIVLKTQATVGDVSYILQLQAYPGTIYHIATRIIQQHRGELGITEETVSSDFHLTYLLYQQIPGYQSVRA